MSEERKQVSKTDFKNTMVKAFRLIDEDNKGRIDFNNLKNLAIMFGEQVSDQEVINMLNVADDDGDGKVDLGEFLKLMDRAINVE